MTPTPPPPVDRIDRAANPWALAILAFALVATMATIWLAPAAMSAMIVSWVILGLAAFGGAALILFAFGLLQLPGRNARLDTTKAIVDTSPDGFLVTDRESRILYANEAYRLLSGAGATTDLLPVERLFTGSPDVSESVYRLAQAAKSRQRAVEELRLAPAPNRTGDVAWYRIRALPIEDIAKDGLTVWTVFDETREHSRHETFFQDLQHAIDYLDHAPAGFFSSDSDGSIVHMNATLAGWLNYDLAQFGVGRLKVSDIIAGDGAAMLTMISGRPREVTTQQIDVDLKSREGRALPVRIFHKIAFSVDGTPGPSRSLVINRAPRRNERRGESSRGRSALRTDLQLDPGRDRRGRSCRRARPAECGFRATGLRGAESALPWRAPFAVRAGDGARPVCVEIGDRCRVPRTERHRVARRVARGLGRALGAPLRLRRRPGGG